MKRRVFLIAISLPLLVQAGQPPFPKGVQAGAKFLWDLAMGPKAPFDAAKLSDDRHFLRDAHDISKSLEAWRGNLIPNVDALYQYSFARGEERTVYGLYSKTKGSRYFEVHILGMSNPQGPGA